MATRRGEKTSLLLELKDRSSTSESDHQYTSKRPHFRKEQEFIERTVLPTDTLQGIALLYNTSVSQIKKLNQLHTDGELHARRVIKVPSRGILINLEEAPVPETSVPNRIIRTPTATLSIPSDEDESETKDSGIEYLNSKDSVLTEIRANVDKVAANSPILNGSDEHSDGVEVCRIRKGIRDTTLDRKKESSIKWWHLFFPCFGFVILFPILLFIFQEHLHDLGHRHHDHDSGIISSESSVLQFSSSIAENLKEP